jgi:hypothetical protein
MKRIIGWAMLWIPAAVLAVLAYHAGVLWPALLIIGGAVVVAAWIFLGIWLVSE